MSWSSSLETGKNDMALVCLRGPEGDSLQVYLFGATVTSWVHKGNEKIFVSSKAIFNGTKAIRGGIPVVFPQFGRPLTEMAQHGFARISYWEVKSMTSSEASAEVILSLCNSASTVAQWPHEFELQYRITLLAGSLVCALSVTNTDTSSFQCHTLLHTYLAVNSLLKSAIVGFKGFEYVDKLLPGEHKEDREQVTLRGEVDRIVHSNVSSPVPDIVLLQSNDIGALEPTMKMEKHAAITSLGASDAPVAVDVVYWNPSTSEKALGMADLDAATESDTFVCIEPGTVMNWTNVGPNETLTLTQALSAL